MNFYIFTNSFGREFGVSLILTYLSLLIGDTIFEEEEDVEKGVESAKKGSLDDDESGDADCAVEGGEKNGEEEAVYDYLMNA
jgi:hypothetical protein